jgi:hypothetical protein
MEVMSSSGGHGRDMPLSEADRCHSRGHLSERRTPPLPVRAMLGEPCRRRRLHAGAAALPLAATGLRLPLTSLFLAQVFIDSCPPLWHTSLIAPRCPTLALAVIVTSRRICRCQSHPTPVQCSRSRRQCYWPRYHATAPVHVPHAAEPAPRANAQPWAVSLPCEHA